MIVYSNGDKVKVKEDSTSLGVDLKKDMKGVVVAVLPGRVEVAIEGLGLVSVTTDLIKKKVTKTERKVKAKNLKMTDEVYLPGTGEFNKIANVYREDYDTNEPEISVETVAYDSHRYTYNELVSVRR